MTKTALTKTISRSLLAAAFLPTLALAAPASAAMLSGVSPAANNDVTLVRHRVRHHHRSMSYGVGGSSSRQTATGGNPGGYSSRN